MEQFIGFIPSTLNSPKRLPGKALSEIEGIPIIVHVAKRASLSSNLKKIIVCTDSNRIAEICRKFANRDHTTVIHAVKTIDKLLNNNDEIKKNVEELKSLILSD